MKPMWLCAQRSGWVAGSGVRSRTVTFIGSSPSYRRRASVLRQSRVGFQRIIDADLACQVGRQASRQRVVAVEMPVRIVGGEQQHPVGAELFEDGEELRLGGGRVE